MLEQQQNNNDNSNKQSPQSLVGVVLFPRNLVDFSPSTNAIASKTVDFPLPFGPTIL
jgi:hypothetical protein